MAKKSLIQRELKRPKLMKEAKEKLTATIKRVRAEFCLNGRHHKKAPFFLLQNSPDQNPIR